MGICLDLTVQQTRVPFVSEPEDVSFADQRTIKIAWGEKENVLIAEGSHQMHLRASFDASCYQCEMQAENLFVFNCSFFVSSVYVCNSRCYIVVYFFGYGHPVCRYL